MDFQANDSVKRRPSVTNKRKRDSFDSAVPAVPNKRRTSTQFLPHPPQQQTGVTAAEGLGDLTDQSADNFLSPSNSHDDPSTHFDFQVSHHGNDGQTQQSTPSQGQDLSANTNVDTAAAALSQHYSMTVPRHPAESFIDQPTTDADDDAINLEAERLGLPPFSNTPGKPPVGSDEWHKVRKDNHKEVERRRRETINEGINELSKIVPGCEKNKGSILQRAVQYIAKLHDEAAQNIDKWTFEKLVTEQAINDLSGKLARAWAEKEAWKRVARDAGVDVDAADLRLQGAVGGGEAGEGGVAAGAGAGVEGQRGEGEAGSQEDVGVASGSQAAVETADA